LTSLGWKVINPHYLHDDPPSPWDMTVRKGPEWEKKWRKYLSEDIPALLSCDGICLLPNWTISRGAAMEWFVALMARIPAYAYIDREPYLRPMFTDAIVADMVVLASVTLSNVMGENAESHGLHTQWLSKTPQFHIHKAIKHAGASRANLDFFEPPQNGEGAKEHMERAVVRSLMALSRYNQLSDQLTQEKK